MSNPKMTSGKAGVGIVTVDGHEGRFVALDIGTAQIFLSPDDAIKLANKIKDLAYLAMHPDKCKWCGSEEDVIQDECNHCRSEMKREMRRARVTRVTNQMARSVVHKSIEQEYRERLGYSGKGGTK